MAITLTNLQNIGLGGYAQWVGTETEGLLTIVTGSAPAYGGMVQVSTDQETGWGCDNIIVLHDQNGGLKVESMPAAETGNSFEISIISGDLQSNQSYQFGVKIFPYNTNQSTNSQPGQ